MSEPTSDSETNPSEHSRDPEASQRLIQDHGDVGVACDQEAAPNPALIPKGLPQTKSLFMQVARLSIWPFLELVTVSMVGIADTWLAGNLPERSQIQPAAAAITIAAYSLWLVGMLQGALGVGATAMISRMIGEDKIPDAQRALVQSLIGAVIWGVVLSVLMLVGASRLASWSGLENEAADYFTLYFWILAFAATPRALMFVANACFRGAGEMNKPFIIMVTVNVVNILVSGVLVMAPAPFGGYGVTGIAIGTGTAWILGASMAMFFLLRGGKILKLTWKLICFEWDMLKRIVKISVPTLFESIGHWAGNFVILIFIGYWCTEAEMGAHGVAIRIESFSFLPGFAIGMAAATIAGQYIGAGNPKRAKQALWVCWLYGAGAMFLCGLAFIFIPEFLVRIMTLDPQHREIAPPLLRLAGYVQIFFGTYLVFSKGIQGAGDTKSTMIITYCSTYFIRLPLVIVFGYVLGWGLWGIWIGLMSELIARGLLFLGRFLNGGWTRIKV